MAAKIYSFSRRQIVTAGVFAVAGLLLLHFVLCRDEPLTFYSLNCGVLANEQEVVGVAKKYALKRNPHASDMKVASFESFEADDFAPIRAYVTLILGSSDVTSSSPVLSFVARQKRVGIALSYCGEIISYENLDKDWK